MIINQFKEKNYQLPKRILPLSQINQQFLISKKSWRKNIRKKIGTMTDLELLWMKRYLLPSKDKSYLLNRINSLLKDLKRHKTLTFKISNQSSLKTLTFKIKMWICQNKTDSKLIKIPKNWNRILKSKKMNKFNKKRIINRKEKIFSRIHAINTKIEAMSDLSSIKTEVEW